ncbi:hypothetical protein D3C75_1016900 [compost metagenome]
MSKVVVAALLYCGCHVGSLLRVEKSQAQGALQDLIDAAPRKRYIAFYADGEWTDPNNYISDKASWEEYFNRKLEQ